LVVLLPDPFQGMEALRKSGETQQSGRTPKFGPEMKDEEVMPKMARGRGSDTDISDQRLGVLLCGAVISRGVGPSDRLLWHQWQ